MAVSDTLFSNGTYKDSSKTYQTVNRYAFDNGKAWIKHNPTVLALNTMIFEVQVAFN